MPSRSRALTIATRVCFVCYTGALLTATHWPGLAVKSSFSRMDLVIHAGIFACWGILLGLTGWVRPASSPLKRAITLVLIGIAYGIFDETTQPLFRRVFDLLDLAADATGVTIAGIAMFYWWNRGSRALADDSLVQPSPDTRS